MKMKQKKFSCSSQYRSLNNGLCSCLSRAGLPARETLDRQHHQQANQRKTALPVFPRPVPANDIAPPLALAGRCGLAHGFNGLNCSDQKFGNLGCSCGKPRAEPERLGWKPVQQLHTQRMSGAIELYKKYLHGGYYDTPQ